MSKLFTVEVVNIRGEPLSGAIIACYTPLCCEVAYTDTLDVPDSILDLLDHTTVMILRVRKYGYLPAEIAVSCAKNMKPIRVTMIRDDVVSSNVWIDKVKTKVQDTFVGLKDLLI